ncbi:sulfotransferase domain-containing protein, partial [Nocardioides sp. BGMRC 2183]
MPQRFGEERLGQLPMSSSARRSGSLYGNTTQDQGASMTRAPKLDFAIIGAQKSASTYLQDILTMHPEICLHAGEIAAFEDPWYHSGTSTYIDRLFDSSGKCEVRGIKRPDSLARPEVPPRLAADFPDLRLIVVLRDPVSRAVSAYFHYVRHRWIPHLQLNQGFEALLNGSLRERYSRANEILDFGNYGEHLTRYLSHFPKSSFLVISQEDLLANPALWAGRALRHVGVDATSSEVELPTRASNEGIYADARLSVARAVNGLRYEYDATSRLRLRRRFSV